MKVIYWNGSYFANKGCTRSDHRSMFSVGGLIAFEVTSYSSPDGRSYSHGCIPCGSDYKLQEELILEEFDRTESDPRYHCGTYDVQEIVELKNVFWHEYERPVVYKTFLLGILNTSENVFAGGFISGEISEVRNNLGKFLHIYEIPEGYRGCKGESFEATVVAINLQKKQEDEYQLEVVVNNYRGRDLDFGITTRGGWYKPSAGFGTFRISRQHEHDDSGTSLGKIKIMPCVPDGFYQFYIWGYPVSLNLGEGEPSLSLCASSSWCNNQSWWYDNHDSTNIQPGWIFVDGVDVYDCTKKIIDENKAKKLVARQGKFAEAKAKATEAGFTETQVGQLIKLAGKGSVIATLNSATRMVVENKYGIDFTLQILKDLRSKNLAVIEAYAYLLAHAREIKLSNVKRAAEKAYAWSYLNNLIPGFGAGYFDDAMEALRLALANGVSFKK